MGARFQSFLLGLGPVRRAVHGEIARAIQPTVRSAQEALATHRMALRARDELVAELRAHNDELREHDDDLRRRIAELEADTQHLRTALAAARQAVERRRQRDLKAEQRRRQQRKAATPEPHDDTTSDLFRCLACSSLWLLSTTPDQIRTARRPVGNGCHTCADRPLRRLPEIKTSLARSDAATDVARPAAESPAPPDDEGVTLVAELVKNDQDAAIATTIIRDANQFSCAGLDAIANGIDRTPKAVSNGIAWCATGISGGPEFPTTVLREVVTRAALEPASLQAIARLVRLVGAASCAADNRLEECPCARHLNQEAAGVSKPPNLAAQNYHPGDN